METHPGTAVVSGALSIIGAAYAEYLARKGYDLVLIDQHRLRLNRMADTLSTRFQRAVEVVVVRRRSPLDLAAAAAQIEGDASIVVVVNVANAQGRALLSATQAHALIDGDWSDREIGLAAIRKFLSRRGAVRTYRADVSVFTASHVTTPPLI